MKVNRINLRHAGLIPRVQKSFLSKDVDGSMIGLRQTP